MPDLPSLLLEPLPRAGAGLLLAALIAIVACRLRSLSVSGAVATTLVGGAIVGGAGWWTGLVLVIYFVTSSGLSNLRADATQEVDQARGKRRDAWQVLANGGVAAVLALFVPVIGAPQVVAVGCLAAIAAATADTWATEIGKQSPTPPRLITTWRTVVPGTSGAISLAGSLGALAGSALIAVMSVVGWSTDIPAGSIGATAGGGIVLLGGIIGAMSDSLLGATMQERRWCPECNVPTERRVHRCGMPTTHVGGWEWMTNDAVNATSIAIAATVALALAGWVST